MSKWPGNPRREITTFGGLRREKLMARVGSTGNQTTELRLASLLRQARLSGWRRHQPLPGKPDFVWRTPKVAVFVDGCFWHGHDCGRNVTPKTNARAWEEKISRTKTRDRKVSRLLRKDGWKVVRMWECQLRKNPNRCLRRIAEALSCRGWQLDRLDPQ